MLDLRHWTLGSLALGCRGLLALWMSVASERVEKSGTHRFQLVLGLCVGAAVALAWLADPSIPVELEMFVPKPWRQLELGAALAVAVRQALLLRRPPRRQLDGAGAQRLR